MPGIRKNSKLLLIKTENQLYKTRSASANHVRYVCYIKECQVSVIILKSNNECKKLNNKEHNHERQDEFIEKLELMNSIKTQCSNVSLKRNATIEIFDNECLKNLIPTARLLQYGKMKRNLCGIKNAMLPKNPTCPLDVQKMFRIETVLNKFGTSKCKFPPGTAAELKHFYKDTVIEKEFAYSVFMSPSICQAINLSPQLRRNYLLDGTFSVVPECGYKQLMIIHVENLNHVSVKNSNCISMNVPLHRTPPPPHPVTQPPCHHPVRRVMAGWW